MNEEAAKCGTCGTPLEDRARYARVNGAYTGETVPDPYCPRCEDDLCHLYAMLDSLMFCWCGNPDDAYQLIRDLLAAVRPPGDDWHPSREATIGRIGVRDEDYGPYQLVMGLLDHAGLIEHGTSIFSPWLTPKGRHYLPLMQAHEFDELTERSSYLVGYPHDGQECPEDCRHRQAIRVA